MKIELSEYASIRHQRKDNVGTNVRGAFLGFFLAPVVGVGDPSLSRRVKRGRLEKGLRRRFGGKPKTTKHMQPNIWSVRGAQRLSSFPSREKTGFWRGDRRFCSSPWWAPTNPCSHNIYRGGDGDKRNASTSSLWFVAFCRVSPFAWSKSKDGSKEEQQQQ